MRDIRKLLSVCHIARGNVLFRSGDSSVHLYVIREGQIRLTRSDINGQERLVGLVGRGYLLGFDTIGNSHYSYSAETLTPAVLCQIRHASFVRVLEAEPRVSLNVLLAINEQLAQARNLIHTLGQKTAIEKIASLLLNLYPSTDSRESGEPIALHLSRREMARILGLTVETVSRFMAALRRQGIIDAPPRHIVIRARARLQALAGDSPYPLLARKQKSCCTATRLRAARMSTAS